MAQLIGFQRYLIIAKKFKFVLIFMIPFETLYSDEPHASIIKPINKYWHLILCLVIIISNQVIFYLNQIENR